MNAEEARNHATVAKERKDRERKDLQEKELSKLLTLLIPREVHEGRFSLTIYNYFLGEREITTLRELGYKCTHSSKDDIITISWEE